jgi:3-hydroxyacyl-CoA dehydrogenase
MNTDRNIYQNGPISMRFDAKLAIITIDNPPVNAGSTSVRAGLLECLQAAGEMTGLIGVILIGAGRGFIAGSDIREFGAPLESPELPQVISAAEALPMPVVAAIHGAALGGGFELALGCDLRVAAPDAILGLPEVSLGMVPGAGGTQRLPRLTGVAKAIELVCASRRVGAVEALQLGMIDEIAASANPADLIAAARHVITTHPGKRNFRDTPVPADKPGAIEAAVSAALSRRGCRPNVKEAARLVQLSRTAPADAALAEERAAFQTLRIGEDAFALRHLFFSERAASRVEGLTASPTPLACIGIVGGGTMGQGIARALLGAGLHVIVAERDVKTAETVKATIVAALDTTVRKGRLTAAEAKARAAALDTVGAISGLAQCDLVIEAAFEDMEVKRAIFRDLDAVLRQGALLATNTSYLDIDEIAAATTRPADVLGLHFFGPADVMKLLEIVRARETSEAALATGLALAKRLGKQPVVASVAEGFIGNRIYAAYRRHAEFLIADGASPIEVDTAIEAFGFAMGPFKVADLSGLDIAWRMRQRLAESRDPQARYVDIPDRLCEAGRFGRKATVGWYSYASGKPEPDPFVSDVIEAARRDTAMTPQSFTPEQIVSRLMAAIINEAACVLREGIAQNPGDVDVALVHGYGFPRWRGGPLWWAAGQSRSTLNTTISELSKAQGKGFVAGPVDDVLFALRHERSNIL